MENKKITVCLRNFNVNRLIWFQAPGQGSGGMPSLLEAMAKGGSKKPGAKKPEPVDHRGERPSEESVEKTVTAELDPNVLGAPMSGSVEGYRAGINGKLRAALDGTVGRVPIVGNTITHPIRAIKSMISKALHPVRTARNATNAVTGAVKRTFRRKPKL